MIQKAQTEKRMNTAQKEKTKQMLRVFLTYSKTDGEYARRLRSLLSRYLNLHIFTPEMLSAGEDWLSKIKNEVSQCDVFIALLSPDSINSEWILSEMGAAWALNKLIIPVITQPELFSEIPIDLGKYQPLEIKYLEEHPEAMDQIFEYYEEKTSLHSEV